MQMLKFVGLTIVFLLLFQEAQAQGKYDLEKLRVEWQREDSIRAAKVQAYAVLHNIPIAYNDAEGNDVLMVDVDSFGLPVYIATHNIGAAQTTGTWSLRPSGELGLSLEGEGMTVGVFDGGTVIDHIEFRNQIVNREGAVSNHATHVTGTIMAAGLNPSARGMAPKTKASTWAFDNDVTKMAALAQNGVVLSNHSYGLVTGWRFDAGSWTWFGNPSISTQEDFRFGLYSEKSQNLDMLVYSAPEYTIVWSAGNDRNNVGNGVYPPDCNGGTGYDCIASEGVAKNIITVGAVQKVIEYASPSSVQMSDFSSWGPTDDGRIKPDIVAAGVGLLSTGSASTEAYSTLSGTSMSAPNVTGSLVLLQELHKKLNNGALMPASMVKALIIHTAKDAGNKGPDYSFGWGLLDAREAAQFLLEIDGINKIIHHGVLSNDQLFDLPLRPKKDHKITVTIVWTDPPPQDLPPAALDPINPNLVNDLDVRLIGEDGSVELPWILNRMDPSSLATKGDNHADNVEKIEFDEPREQIYTLRVSHKGTLVNKHQAYSLIVTYTSQTSVGDNFYWIGNTGHWDDPNAWSLSPGGGSAGIVPGAIDKVYFNDKSFSEDNQEVVLTGNAACASINWLASRPATINVSNYSLEVHGDLLVGNDKLAFNGNGTLKLVGKNHQFRANFTRTNMSTIDIVVDAANATYLVGGETETATLALVQGNLTTNRLKLKTQHIKLSSLLNKVFNVVQSELEVVTSFSIEGNNLLITGEGSSLTVRPNAHVFNFGNNGKSIPFRLTFSGGNVLLGGNGIYQDVVVDAHVQLLGNNTFNKLLIKGGSVLSLAGSTVQHLTAETVFESNAEKPITVESTGTSVLSFSDRFKLCFDYLNVSNVSIGGNAVINAGQNSVLSSAENWQNLRCEDVLFADFDVLSNCAGGLTQFIDQSSGRAASRRWIFEENEVQPLESNVQTFYSFSQPGDYRVTLQIANESSLDSYSRIVTILPNPMELNQVVFSDGLLVSVKPSATFQWFRNLEPIEGATQRSYRWDGNPGNFAVLTAEGDCNRLSEPFVISSALSESGSAFQLYPNPAHDKVFVTKPWYLSSANIAITDVLGRLIRSEIIRQDVIILDLSDYTSGVYFVTIDALDHRLIYKLVLSK